MRKYIMAGLAALATATSANAAIVTGYTTGAIPSYTTASASPFETFSGAPGNGSQYTPAQGSGAYAETVTGSVGAFNAGSSNPTFAKDPATAGSVGNYLSVTSGGSFGVNFGAGVQFFSFAFGTLDSYNLLTLTVGGSQISYTGTQLAAISGGAIAADGTAAATGRFYFDATGGAPITSAVFSSSGNSFEIDTLAAAAPEPGTWALMILGFGLVGSQLRLRRRNGTLAAA